MRASLIIALLLAVFSGADATARSKEAAVPAPVAEMPATVFAGDRVTLEQAVRRVRSQYGGRIVSAETRGSGNNRVHVIKVLTDGGRVMTVRIAAN